MRKLLDVYGHRRAGGLEFFWQLHDGRGGEPIDHGPLDWPALESFARGKTEAQIRAWLRRHAPRLIADNPDWKGAVFGDVAIYPRR